MRALATLLLAGGCGAWFAASSTLLLTGRPLPALAFADQPQEAATSFDPFPVTTHPEPDFMPALSPDGRWLLYVSRQNKNYDLWVRPAAGGLAVPLTTNTSDDYSPAWSPDGRAVVFVSRRDDAAGDLYLLHLKFNAQGPVPGKLKRLTANLEREGFPQFAPHGREIAYSRGTAGAEEIWRYNLTTGESHRLTHHGGTHPAWSPEGRGLAVVAPVSGEPGRQVFLIDLDSTQTESSRRQLTWDGDYAFPAWSPDGRSLVVQRFALATGSGAEDFGFSARARSQLCLLVPSAAVTSGDTTAARQLLLTPAREGALFPCWGRDRAIYYGADHYGNLDIWRMPEDGRFPRFEQPQAAFANALQLRDPELAALAFAALRFNFADSILWQARATVEIGRCHLAMGDTAVGREIFTSAVTQYGSRFEAGGMAEIELAKLDPSPQRFAGIHARYQEWPAVQALCTLETGKTLQRQGELEAALRYLQAIPQRHPQVEMAVYESYLHAGDILLTLARFEESEASFVNIITGFRTRQEWRAVAIARLLDGAVQSEISADTMAAYQRMLQEYAAEPAIALTARFRIAARLAREGELQLAENEFRGLIAAMAGQQDTYVHTLRAQAMYEALRLHLRSNEIPAAAQLYLTLAQEHGGARDREILRQARQEITAALIRRAQVFMRAQDFDLALSQFRQAREYDVREVEAHRGYVEAMHALGRIDEAVAEYERLTKSAPGDEILLYSLGLAYSYKGEHSAGTLRHSAALIERALAVNYRLVPAYLTLGFNYEAIEKLEQQERTRPKGFLERVALALPRLLDNVRRAVTFRPPRLPERWYERAIETLTIAIAINDESTHPQREAQLALNLANNYYNFGEFGYENAYRYYLIKLRYDSSFASTRQEAIISERIGQCGWVSGHYREAEPFLRHAVQLYRGMREVDGELRNLQRLALLYQGSGDFENSIEYYRQVINVSRRENRTENVALAWRNIAYNHQQLAESDEAVAKGERTLALLAHASPENFPKPQKSRLTIKLLGLPVFWWTLAPTGEESSAEGLTYEQEKELVFSIIEESRVSRKDFEEAIAAMDRKRESFRRRKDRLGEAIALNNLGSMWYNLREYAKAYEYFWQSWRLCARHNLPPGKIINLINLGNLALLQQHLGEGQLPMAVRLDSLLQVSRADLEQVALQMPRQKLAVFNMLGNLNYYAGERLWSGRATPAADRGAGADRTTPAAQSISQTWEALQYFARARAAYDTALVLAQSQRLRREEVMVRRNLAALHARAGDYAAAWENLRVAHELCVSRGYSDLVWRIEHAIGTLGRRCDLPAGHVLAQRTPREWYLHALGILESLPEEPEGIEQRLIEAAEQRELYENAVMLLAEQGEAHAALNLAERSHASRFINLAATRYLLPKKERHRLIWGGGGGLAAEQRRTLSRLRGELRRLEAEEPPRPKELARVREELARAEQDYQEIVQMALAEDPELASFFSVQTLDLDSFQESLDEGTAILKYFVGREQCLIWLISRDRLELYPVAVGRAQLEQSVAALRQAWQGRRPEAQTLAAGLAGQLLAPVTGLESYRQLLIAADESLHYLPFAALPYHGDLLAEQFTLSRVPSLLALHFAARHRNLNTDNLLVVEDADPVETNNPPERVAGNVSADSLRVQGLAVRVLHGADWRMPDSPARLQIAFAGVLHLKHRFLALPDRPLDSGFVLRFRTGNQARVETGLMPMYRLFEFDLSASLAVLENTSLSFSPGQTGDELIALQRSLIYAGAPTLLLCQWEAAPSVRAAFLSAFYARLAENSIAEAFAAAQGELRARLPESPDWAAFELAGFPGMSAGEKEEYARHNFLATVDKGNRAQDLREYADAVRYYQTALTMARQLGQEDALMRLHLLIKGSAIAARDYATACEVEEKILAGARAAQDVRQQAQSFRNLSVWRLQMRDIAAAAEAERQYLALAETANNAMAAANSRLQLAQIHQAAGDYPAAIAAAEAAAGIYAERSQALPRLQAETLLGKLALEDDRYGTALNYLESGLRHFLAASPAAKTGSAAEQRALATTYQLLGVVYGRLTAYRQALDLHNQALTIFAATGDTANLARAEQFVAETHWLNADYQNALRHQQVALRLSEPLQDELLRIRGQTTLGLIWLSLGEAERALDAQKQTLQLALELEDRREAEAQREQATIHKNIGLVYVQLGQTMQALASFMEAAHLDQQLGFERGLLYDCLNLGQVHQTLGQLDSAATYLSRAEALALKLNDQRAHAKALYSSGLVALARNNRVQARTALTHAQSIAENTALDELQWRCLWQLGILTRQEGSLEAALDFYLRAIAALERLSARIKIEEYRSGFIDNKGELYEEAVVLLLQLKREAEAFAMAERAKSRSFADLLGNSGVDWQAGADRRLLERREALLESISLTQGKIAALQSQPAEKELSRFALAAMNDSLAALQRAYADLLVEMKAANPELADAVSVDPLPLAEVQAMVPDGAALVEFFFAQDRLVSWVVTRTQVRAVSTPLDRSRLQESVMQFRKAIQKRASTESFSRELYEVLFKPLEPMLHDARQLVLVPHGILHYLPFPALQRVDNSYLIDHHALALAPSATVFGFCHRKREALPAQPESNYRVVALGNPDVGNPRLDLPFAEKEIKSLEQTFRDLTSFTRKQATQRALQKAVANADLLHFSCHGVYDDRNPLFSALLLAPESVGDDGRLEAHEIFALRLRTTLVMLSACETGLARVTGGDEVIGLARSFIFAGTPSLIASLWTVDDLATAITVKRFYRYLKSGASKAEALREAQRFVRDHHNRHPAYWASFGLTGEWR